jgi:hypothetical protein
VFQHLVAGNPGQYQHGIARGIHAVQCENILCQINAKRYDVHVDFPFLVW